MQDSYTGTNFCCLDITSVTNLSDKIVSEKNKRVVLQLEHLHVFWSYASIFMSRR